MASCTDEDYQAQVTFTAPPVSGTYQLCMDTDSCSLTCFAVSGGQSITLTQNLDGGCPGNDSFVVNLRISGPSSCQPYRLSYTFDAGRCSTSATANTTEERVGRPVRVPDEQQD
jgi:hypothetical protein